MSTLEATVLHDRVRAIVEQHRADVAELVNAELARMVGELVAERIAAGNGHAESSRRLEHSETSTKQCNRCQQVKPLGEFEKHRNVCKRCRRAREPKQRLEPADDPESG